SWRSRSRPGPRSAASRWTGRRLPGPASTVGSPPGFACCSLVPTDTARGDRGRLEALGREQRLRVAAVIPAYNEEATIGAVIDAVRQVPGIDEVIVVSDGSDDGTAEVARRHGAFVVELDANVGKGGALKAGVQRAD